MRAVVQRVKESQVFVDEKKISNIKRGVLVLLGVAVKDTPADVDYLADKIMNLRIFEDDQGKMNRSLIEIGGHMMVVSQFTLLGDCSKGRRPSYIQAADPEKANTLYEDFVAKVRDKGILVETGMFRAMMDVSLVNDGPVTLIVESK